MPRRPVAARSLSRRAAIQTGIAGAVAGNIALAQGHAAVARQSATPAPAPGEGVTFERVARSVDALDGLIEDLLSRTGVPGLAVSVVHDDELLVARGYGVASTETGDPVDADTVFQLASVSKPIASTVVASIVGDGLVQWDARIVDHLPAFALHDPWVTANVTIRDMFAHRSGLPGHAGDLLEDIGYNRDEVLHRLRYQQPATSFRSAYAYTNFGLTAGAVAASTAAGTTWEGASDERLYGPAGMTRTSSRFDDFVAEPNHAEGHVLIDGAWTPAYVRNPDAQSPAGGVSSTVTDLARWLRLHLNAGMLDGTEVIPADALAETHRPQIISSDIPDPAVDRAGFYGLGWNVSYDDHGAVQLSHSGAFALGAATAVYLLPADGLGIAVLTNAAPIGLAESVALSFLEIARTGDLQIDYLTALTPVFAEIMVSAYGSAVRPELAPAQPSPPQDPAAYVGVYANSLYGEITVANDGGELTLSLGPIPDTYPLAHWDRDIFTYLPTGENANVTSAVTFTVGTDATATQVTVENLDIHGQGTFWKEPAGE